MYLGSSLLNFIRFTSLCQFLTMVLFQFFTTAILLLSITSLRTYSVPYQSIQLPFSITPKLIYTSESNPVFSGYSYTTQDFNGGESNVVFTIGADSMNRLKNEMDSMKKVSEGYSQRDKNQENIISERQSKSKKAEESSKKQDFDSNIKVLNEENEEKKSSQNTEADNNLIEQQTNFQQVSLIDVPYSPILRENLLNSQFPIFPRYQILSNIIQNQYSPYNPYNHLELPLNNFGFYHPVSLFYKTTTIIPDNNSKPTSTVVENIKASKESHITKSSQINATNSESKLVKSSVESRINLESTTNGIEEASLNQSAVSINKLESTTSEKSRKESSTSETEASSQSSIEQTTDNESSSTELSSTETSPLAEKSSVTSKKDVQDV